LHDVGKIAIPDSILHKPGPLNKEERAVMETHSVKGREIIDRILEDAGLQSLQNTDILRNIAQFHHEAINGSGYPNGLVGKDIPLEARIVAVADVFDALSSKRSYKEAWSNEKSFATLQSMANDKLDAECVEALIACRAEVEIIQRQFSQEQCCGL
jgi:HD-GYP domain-containing protein (c-di-GMP phosphodiesterase class II)